MMLMILGIQLGILAYFIIKAKEHIQHKTFSPLVWWRENSMRYFYAAAVGLLISIMVHFYPETMSFIQWAGINLESEALENGAPVLLGGFLAHYAYSPSKNKPSIKDPGDVD